MSAESYKWWVQLGAVLQHEKTGELHHVTSRLYDVDLDVGRYELEDDTHTTREFWCEEDMRDCFKVTDVILTPHIKPLQRLDGRLYDTAEDSQ